jgi:hypothetical protein
MILSPDQLHALTGKRRRDAQERALVLMGVNYLRRADGRLLVGEEYVKKLLAGGEASATVHAREPDWSALAQTPSR